MRWYKGLNPEQIEVVQHTHGPLLVLAGAGSGKTTVLVRRLGRLLEENCAKAENILALTFTNKAARELKHRVMTQMGSKAGKITAGTFHSFGMQLLKKHGGEVGLKSHFAIADSSDSQSLLKEIMKDIRITGKDRFDLDKILNLINLKRAGKKSAAEFDEYQEMAEVLLPKYLRRLELLNLVDFEGLLLKPIELLSTKENIRKSLHQQFQIITVDEFQDTNKMQMDLIHLILGSHQNIMVVGDDDQSIYGWRGAEIQNILSFPKLFKSCKTIKLEKNYRSVSSVLDLANTVIAGNKKRHGKVLQPTQVGSDALIPELFSLENEEEEAEFVVREIRSFVEDGFKLKDIAVLYRSNTQGAFFESSLRQNQIEYSISGGTSIFDRKEIKDMMAYLRVALHPNDLSLRRIINTPARGVGEAALEKLNLLCQQRHISFYEACKQWKHAELPDKVGEKLDELLQWAQQVPEVLLSSLSPGTAGEKFVRMINEMGYKAYLQHNSSEPGAADRKWILIEIFGRILDSYIQKRTLSRSTLSEFLEDMTLRDSDDEELAGVQLMTLHASKGLEFPIVILAGIEEDLLPHKNLGTDIDEERRLFYVGITRAQKRLILSFCRNRKTHGRLKPVTRSRFITSLPEGLIKEYPLGFRPIGGEARDRLVGDFLSRLRSLPTPEKI